MIRLWVTAVAVVTIIEAVPPSVNWEYAPPWQPMNEPCESCEKSRQLQQPRPEKRVRSSNLFDNLEPGVYKKLDPNGRTTIVKMAVEKVKTPENKSVQLVYIPQGRLSSLADKGLARMITSESRTVSRQAQFRPAIALPEPEYSDKQKRDHHGQLVRGGAHSFPMTLVAAEGQENTAKEQLELLEAALSSPQATESKNGQLPRVFIAPSDIPPPPGYVKIPLVPQKQTENNKKQLPPTFLTHSHPDPLPPGFVRLSLPASVSKLSQDIPLVKPDSLSNEFNGNFIGGEPRELRSSQRNNFNGNRAFRTSQEFVPPPVSFAGEKRGGQSPLQQFSVRPRPVESDLSFSKQNKERNVFPQNDGNRIIIVRNNQEKPNEKLPDKVQRNKPTIVNIPIESVFRTEANLRDLPQGSNLHSNRAIPNDNSDFQTDRFNQHGRIPPSPQQFQQNQFPSQPQNNRFPSQPQNNRFPPQPQNNRFPPQPQNNRFPPQPQNNQLQSQIKNNQFPSQIQNNRFPNQISHNVNPDFSNSNPGKPSKPPPQSIGSQHFALPTGSQKSSNFINGNQFRSSERDNLRNENTNNNQHIEPARPTTNQFKSTENNKPSRVTPGLGIKVVSKGEPSQSNSIPQAPQPIQQQAPVQKQRNPEPSIPRQPFFSQNNRPIIGTPATISFKQKLNQPQHLPAPHDPRFMEMIRKQEEQSRPNTFSSVEQRPNNPLSQNSNRHIESHRAHVSQENFVRFPPQSKTTNVRLQSNIQIGNQFRQEPSSFSQQNIGPVGKVTVQQSDASREHLSGFEHNNVSPFPPTRISPTPLSAPGHSNPQFPPFNQQPGNALRPPIPFTPERPIVTTFAPRPSTVAFSPTPFVTSPRPIPNFVSSVRPQGQSHSVSSTPLPFVTSTFEPDTTIHRFSQTFNPSISSTPRPFISSTTPFQQESFFSTPKPSSFGFSNSFGGSTFFQNIGVPRPIRPQPTITPRPLNPISAENAFGGSNISEDPISPVLSPRPVLVESLNRIPSFSPPSGKININSQEQFANSALGRQEPLHPVSDIISNVDQFSAIDGEPGKSFPVPQKINLDENNFIAETTATKPISPIRLTTPAPPVSVTTFKPKFNFNNIRNRPVISSTPSSISSTPESRTPSSVTLPPVETTTTTTLFPPFSVARRRQRLNKKNENNNDIREETERKPGAFTFGARLRPRQRLRLQGKADQETSSSDTKISNTFQARSTTTTTTTTTAAPRSRLRISSRVRGRARGRSTSNDASTTTTSASDTTDRPDEVETEDFTEATEVDVQLKPETTTEKNDGIRRRPGIGADARRRRPGVRRKVPEWIKERRRRLRNRQTTESPGKNISVITPTAPAVFSDINDRPIKFIDNNSFLVAESARVVVTQEPDKLTINDFSKLFGKTVQLPTEAPETNETNIFDSFFNEGLKETTTTKYPESESDDYLKEISNQESSRHSETTSSTTTSPPESVSSSTGQGATQEYVNINKYPFFTQSPDYVAIHQSSRDQTGFPTFYSSDSRVPGARQLDLSDSFSDKTEGEVESPTVGDSSKTEASNSESTHEFEKSFLPDVPRYKREGEDSSGVYHDTIGLNSPNYDSDFAESQDRIIYVQAPVQIFAVHDPHSTILTRNLHPNFETVASKPPPMTDDESSRIFDINPSAYQTVEEGLQLAERNQKPLSSSIDEPTTEFEDILSTTEVPEIELTTEFLPDDVPTDSPTIETSSIELTTPEPSTQEPLAPEPLIITASPAFPTENDTNISTSMSTDSETRVLGHSTVLEVRSSKAKVCFQNGKCFIVK